MKQFIYFVCGFIFYTLSPMNFYLAEQEIQRHIFYLMAYQVDLKVNKNNYPQEMIIQHFQEIQKEIDYYKALKNQENSCKCLIQ